VVTGSSQWLDGQDAAAPDQPQINWNEDGVNPNRDTDRYRRDAALLSSPT